MEKAPVNGVELAYYIQGEGDPLLLIHGTGTPASTWPSRWIENLSKRRMVITYDYRGTGQTEATDEEFTTRDLAEDAAGLLRHLDVESADVLGHSMGGRVAQWLALDNPELVSKLILDSTGPGEFGGSFKVTRGIPLQVAYELVEMGMLDHFTHELREVGFSPSYLEGEAEGFHEFAASFAQDMTTPRNYLRLTYARQLHQTTEMLGDIEAPTLVLVGELETTTGGTGSHVDQARHLAEHIPTADLRVLPGLAHFHFWEDPDGMSALILDWLDDA